MNENIELSLVGEVIPVSLKAADGSTRKYEMREMLSQARDKHLDRLSDRVKTNEKGEVIGIKKYEGMQADLLSSCMFDEEDKPVTAKEVQAWPASVTTKLYKMAQKLNHLTAEEKKDDETKND